MITVKQIQAIIKENNLPEDAIFEFKIREGISYLYVKTPNGLMNYPGFKSFKEILSEKLAQEEDLNPYEAAASAFAAQFGVFGTYNPTP
jgi:hypothetical protein